MRRQLSVWRTMLVTENVGLCGSMARRFMQRGLDFDECFSECQEALIRAARAYKLERGWRFSTYACRAMHFACVRLYRDSQPVQLETGRGGDRSEWMPSLRAEVFMGIDPASVEPAVDKLPPNERSVIRWRFGLNGGHCETLEEVGERLGVSKERARQIQISALGKLRVVLEEMG